MGDSVALQDIKGRVTGDSDESAYDLPITSRNEENVYTNIALSGETLADLTTTEAKSGDIHVSKPEAKTVVSKKLYIFFGVLLTMFVILSVALGVITHILMMRIGDLEAKSDGIQAQIEHLKGGSGETKQTSTKAVQTKMMELESKLEAHKIDTANEIQMQFRRTQSLNLTLENVRGAVTTLSSDQQFIKKNQDVIQAQKENLQSLNLTLENVRVAVTTLRSDQQSIKKIQGTKSAFSIYYTYHTYLTYDNTTNVLRFSSTDLNIGGHYDTRTGIFTCEYRGTYVFVLNLYRKYASDSRVRCNIRNDNGSIAYANAPKYTEDKWNSGSGSAVVHLEPGDKVDVGDCVGTDNISAYTSFMGFLLQAD